MKKFFTFIAIACLSVINAVAAITYETDVEYKSLAELDGKTFAIVNKAEGKALYGSNAQNLGYGLYADAFKSTNSGYMWKIVKDADIDAYYLQLITPAGTDYNCWNMGGVLNSQGEAQGWACSFILGVSDKKGQDIPNGALYELVYTDNGWTMKNVGTGMYTQYSAGPANSVEPTYWTFCTIKEVGEEDPRPTITVLESLKPFIENKTIFTLKTGDSYMYGPNNQNIAMGTWEEASACAHIAGYILENTEFEYRLRAVKADGSDVTVYSATPCYLNTQPAQGQAIFNLGIDQDCAMGSSWILEEAADGKYTIKSLATGGYLQTNTTNETATEWELYVPKAEKVTIDNVSLTVGNEGKLDEDGDFTVIMNYEINVKDPALQGSTMLSAVASYVALDAEGNQVDAGKRTPKISANKENVYVSNLQGGKEYTVKIDKFFVIDRTNADYDTNWGDTVAIVENAAEIKVIPVAEAVPAVELKNMSIKNDPKALIDEDGDYTVTFNYTAKINDETLKAEDLVGLMKYEVYDENFAPVTSGNRDFSLAESSRNVYVSGLTAGKSYTFFTTSIVVYGNDGELINLTDGLPKLTFKVKDPNGPQAIAMKDMSLNVAEGEKIDEDGDFKVVFNYATDIIDPAAVQMPYAMADYEVTDAEGKKVVTSNASFNVGADTKNIYVSGLEEGKTYTMTITKIAIDDLMTGESLCETTKDLPSVTFTTGGAPVVAHTWDFTNWSAETVANLEADYQKEVEDQAWSRIEKAADKDNREKAVEGCYWQVAHGTLTANGQEIAELKGLEFTNTNDRGLAIATNYPSTTLGEYHGAQYLWLGSKNIAYFTIKNVKVGSTIKIGLESHKPAEGRGVTLSNVAENPAAPTVFEEQQWTVAGEGDVVDVVVTNTNGCHIYYIDAEIVDVPSSIQNATVNATVTAKFVKNGNIFIIKNGKMYNVNGAMVK